MLAAFGCREFVQLVNYVPKRPRDPQKECPRKATRSSSRAFCVSRRNSGGKLPRRMMREKFWACINDGAKVIRLEGNARQLLRLNRDLLIIGAGSLFIDAGLIFVLSALAMGHSLRC